MVLICCAATLSTSATAGPSNEHPPAPSPSIADTPPPDRPTDLEHHPTRARRPTPPAVRAAPPQTRPRATPKTHRPAPLPQNRVERVIAYALAQQGDPYFWGADGPNAYDCSGLVVAAYRTVGIDLPHYTGALLGHGRPVSRSAMRRGDLVFTARHHVGLYLGGGRMVVAPKTGDVVKVQAVYRWHAARRILT